MHIKSNECEIYNDNWAQKCQSSRQYLSICECMECTYQKIFLCCMLPFYYSSSLTVFYYYSGWLVCMVHMNRTVINVINKMKWKEECKQHA